MAGENGAAATVTALFGEEELRDVSGVPVGDSFRGGDVRLHQRALRQRRRPPPHLRVRRARVCCDCTPGCDEAKLSPAAFEKHSGRETAGRRQNTVWVIVKGDKVTLSKTGLLKYYHKKLKSANGSGKGGRQPPCHRDEFVRYPSCGKERRFRLRTKEECRLYHDAAARHDWTCKDMAPAGRSSLST